MILVVPAGAVAVALTTARAAGVAAYVVGEIVPGAAVGGARYVEVVE